MSGFLLANVTSPNARWPICAGNLWAVLGLMAGLVNRPMRYSLSGESPARWIPSSRQQIVLWVLCGLSILGWVWTSNYAYHFFRGSVNNNNGLRRIDQINRIREMREMANDPKLPEATRNNYRQQVERANLMGMRSDAIECFQEAISWNPHFITSYYKLASMYSSSQRPEDLRRALRTYEQDLQKYAPNFSQVRYNLGLLYDNLSRFEEGPERKKLEKKSLENYRLAARMTISAERRLPDKTRGLSENQIFANMLVRAGLQRKSHEFTAADFPDPGKLVLRLKKASDPLSKELRKRLPQSTLQLLDQHEKREKVSENLRNALLGAFNEAIRGESLHDPALFRDTKLSVRTHRRLESAPQGEALLRFNRSLLAQAWPELIAWHPMEEATEVAAKVFDAWNEILLKDKPVRRTPQQITENVRTSARYYAQIAIQSDCLDEAIFALRRLLELEPDDKAVLRDIATAYRKKKDSQGLAQYLESYLDKYPMNDMARFWLTRARLDQKDLPEAKRQALMLRQAHPQIIDTSYLLFEIAEEAGNAEEARRYGGEYLEKGKNREWIDKINRYLKIQPNKTAPKAGN